MNYLAFWMLILVIIQIRSKLNDRIVKSDAILTKLGGKTYTVYAIIFAYSYFRGFGQVR